MQRKEKETNLGFSTFESRPKSAVLDFLSIELLSENGLEINQVVFHFRFRRLGLPFSIARWGSIIEHAVKRLPADPPPGVFDVD